MMVKVCGITRREDAAGGGRGGSVGDRIYFLSEEPALCDARDGGGIGQRGWTSWKVGVFVDESPAAIEAVMRAAQLDIAQIYGGDRPRTYARLEGASARGTARVSKRTDGRNRGDSSRRPRQRNIFRLDTSREMHRAENHRRRWTRRVERRRGHPHRSALGRRCELETRIGARH